MSLFEHCVVVLGVLVASGIGFHFGWAMRGDREDSRRDDERWERIQRSTSAPESGAE